MDKLVILVLMIGMYLITYGLGYLHGQLDMIKFDSSGHEKKKVVEEKTKDDEKKEKTTVNVLDTSDLREQILKEKIEMSLKKEMA